MALWREQLFAWMTKNSESAMEFFELPTNRVVELGSSWRFEHASPAFAALVLLADPPQPRRRSADLYRPADQGQCGLHRPPASSNWRAASPTGLIGPAGTRTDSWQIGASVLKFGLIDHSDLQLGITPYVAIGESGWAYRPRLGHRRHDGALQARLTGDGAPVQVAPIPFVKLPTAKHGIGNGKVEGPRGPNQHSTGGPFTVVFGPELDLLTDTRRRWRHLQLVNLVNVSAPLAPRLTLAASCGLRPISTRGHGDAGLGRCGARLCGERQRPG